MNIGVVRTFNARAEARAPRTTGIWLVSLAMFAGCSDTGDPRLKATTNATYDKATGKLTELTYDANKNGRIDTWTEMDGSRPLRSRIDRNEDGRPDRWEYYDGKGGLVKVGFSRRDTGTPDAWAYQAADGSIARTEDDTNGDGRLDKWETYDRGELSTAAFDENGDGRPDRRLTYRAGVLVLIESDPDDAGNFRRRADVK
jgi:hypothetical protein